VSLKYQALTFESFLDCKVNAFIFLEVLMIRGIAAAPGIAIGKARVKKESHTAIVKRSINNVSAEKNRYRQVLQTAKLQIAAVAARVTRELGSEQAAIIEAQLLMVEDPELLAAVERRIETERVNAEYAFQIEMERYLQLLNHASDAYLQERVADLKDVTLRVANLLLADDVDSGGQITDTCIIVAHDLMPSETAQLDRTKVLGFVTASGGATSHTVVMARTLGIAAVVGAASALDVICDGDLLVVDGSLGMVWINPGQQELSRLEQQQHELQNLQHYLDQLREVAAVTRDGRPVILAANLGNYQDVDLIRKKGVTAIGLFRTEFLYMDQNHLPDEAEQFRVYQAVLTAMDGQEVIARTLDIGGDKKLPYLEIPPEENPFLGYRAIRLCLECRDWFKTQLRALLRASVFGHLKIMFPMITNLDELRQAKQLIAEAKQELQSEQIAYNNQVEIGMMVEVPAAALMSDKFAPEVDFFSIGTNDLTQYTLAVDRCNPKVASLYTAFDPAVLRLIQLVINNAHQAGKPVGMCGEMAGDPLTVPLLLGFGLDEFSVNPGALLKVKQAIRRWDTGVCQQLAREVMRLSTAEAVRDYLIKANHTATGMRRGRGEPACPPLTQNSTHIRFLVTERRKTNNE
jgi:phosphotransferase system enzyme I (PtsI)